MSEQVSNVSALRHLLRTAAAAVFATALIAGAPATSAAPRPAAGNGEPAAAHTGIAAVLQAGGSDQNVYYVGASGQIYDWFYNGAWSNGQLGTGEAAEPGPAIAAVVQPSGDQNVYYVGANGQVYNWFYDGAWSNGQLGTGEAAEAGTGITAVFSTFNDDQYVYYVGANGQMQTWFYDGAWSGGQLGTGEAAKAGTGTAVVVNGLNQNVYYVGKNGQIYNWVYNNDNQWRDKKL